jgi:LMBR1 domain-containing protein 1
MMSSLIFNVGLILLSSLAVAQFCTMSFAEYARYTASASEWGLTQQTQLVN